MGIGIDMSLDSTVFERSNYTLLDVLSDVGGLESVIAAVVSFILSILNYNNLDNMMIMQLFSFPAYKSADPNKPKKRGVTNFKPSLCGNLGDYFLDKLPSRCRVCKRTRRQKQFEAAIERLNQETDVIKLIR
jgi:hypothetical protein